MSNQLQNHAEAEAPLLLNREAAAKRFAISTRFLAELTAEGVLPVVRLGRRCVRWPLAECDEIILRYKTGGAK